MQVDLTVGVPELRVAEDQLGIQGRGKEGRLRVVIQVPLHHRKIVPAPGDHLRRVPAKPHEVRDGLLEGLAARQLLLRDARHLADMLVQPAVKPGLHHLAEGRLHVSLRVQPAGAYLDDLMGHAQVRRIAVLVPLQVEDDDAARALLEQRAQAFQRMIVHASMFSLTTFST